MSNEWKPQRKFVDPNRLTRKVFDKHVDRMEQKRTRDREDHRADMKALIQRLITLEAHLDLVSEHQQDHCHDLDLLATETGTVNRKHGREGL